MDSSVAAFRARRIPSLDDKIASAAQRGYLAASGDAPRARKLAGERPANGRAARASRGATLRRRQPISRDAVRQPNVTTKHNV